MAQIRWILACILVIGVVFAIEDNELETVKVKRQNVISINTRMGPLRETILVSQGEDLVFLTGNNAVRFAVGSAQSVSYSSNGDLIIPGVGFAVRGIDKFTVIAADQSITSYDISDTVSLQMGPGALYTSNGLALYVVPVLLIRMIDDIRMTAPPLTSQVSVQPDIQNGQMVLVLNVANFEMTLTGARTIQLRSLDRVRYTNDNRVIVRQGGEIITFNGITLLGAFYNEITGVVFSNFTANSTTPIFRGPGQVYINEDTNVALVVSSAARGIAESINLNIVQMSFSFTTVGTNTVEIFDSGGVNFFTLSSDTIRIDLGFARLVRYSLVDGSLTFEDDFSERRFSGINSFFIFDNNAFSSITSTMTIDLSTGGILYISSNNDAFFVSNSNPALLEEFARQTPSVTSMFYYDIQTSDDHVQFLTVRGRDLVSDSVILNTTQIQVLTGSYVSGVRQQQSIIYGNNETLILDANGNVETRLVGVDRLVVNTGSIPFGDFYESSIFSFSGPGTLSYNRGTAFFTTDSSLGSSVSFASQTAPIPSSDYVVEEESINEIDGVNFTERVVIQYIGGERVMGYVATSYDTTLDQEVLYQGGTVSVYRRPFAVRMVSFSGQTLEYFDELLGERVSIPSSALSVFMGGEVLSFMNFTFNGRGRLYVSDDGSQALFSTSHLVTPEVATAIRDIVNIDFTINNIDQFSSVYTGVFNLSTDSATVIYPGGGKIFYRLLEGINYALYVDDPGLNTEIHEFVASFLGVTKSAPAKTEGFIRIIFNGRNIYSFVPIQTNLDFLIHSDDFFTFALDPLSNGTVLISRTLFPNVPYPVSDFLVFDGIEVKQFDIDDVPRNFSGPGLLLLQEDTAIYITSRPAINFFRQAINNLRFFFSPPEIDQPQVGRARTKLLFDLFQFGTDVTAYEGATITFDCSASGRPEPTYQFFRVFNETLEPLLNGTDSITIVDNILVLDDLQIDDTGVYVCRADNGVPPASELTSSLTVRDAVAPVLRPFWFPFQLEQNQTLWRPTSPPSRNILNMREFDEIVLACQFSGRPRPTVSWTFNGMAIEDVFVRFSILDDFGPGRSVLIIRQGIPESAPYDFQCQASNEGGTSTGRVDFDIIRYQCGSRQLVPCSVTCGFAITQVTFDCTRFTNEISPSPVDFDDVPFFAVPLDERTSVCNPVDEDNNIVICPVIEYRWNASEWTECSRTCGSGDRVRDVECIKTKIPLDNRYQAFLNLTMTVGVVNDSLCERFPDAKPRPISRELCNEQKCPVWITGGFSPCSVTCGRGERVRSVTCNEVLGRFTDMNGVIQLNTSVVNDSFCNNESRPFDSSVCDRHRCPFRWRLGAFGLCNDLDLAIPSDEFSFCRQRTVECYNADPDVDMAVSDDFCDDIIEAKPSAVSSCGGGRCFNGLWETDNWGPCSASCGYGTQERILMCRSPITFTIVPFDFCDVADKPITTQQCFLRNCENECLRDESSLCPFFALTNMCGTARAMGDNGLLCCVTCMMAMGRD